MRVASVDRHFVARGGSWDGEWRARLGYHQGDSTPWRSFDILGLRLLRRTA